MNSLFLENVVEENPVPELPDNEMFHEFFVVDPRTEQRETLEDGEILSEDEGEEEINEVLDEVPEHITVCF